MTVSKDQVGGDSWLPCACPDLYSQASIGVSAPSGLCFLADLLVVLRIPGVCCELCAGAILYVHGQGLGLESNCLMWRCTIVLRTTALCRTGNSKSPGTLHPLPVCTGLCVHVCRGKRLTLDVAQELSVLLFETWSLTRT